MAKRANLVFIIILGVLLFSGGCSLKIPDKSELSKWYIDLEIPILDKSITLRDFLGDTLDVIPINDSGDSIFVYRDTMEIDTTEVGDQLSLDPIHKRFVQQVNEVTIDSTNKHFTTTYDTIGIDDVNKSIAARMGLIELTNLEADTTDPFLFRDIMPADLVNQIEQALASQGGSAKVVIDTTDLVPQSRFFEFSSLQEAYVEEGSITLTIINQMFIPLGSPINIDLSDTLDNLIEQVIIEDEVPTNQTYTTVLDISGKTLPGKIKVTVSGTSNGSHGDSILVTNASLDTYFKIVIQPEEIKVSETVAQVPSQTIQDTSDIPLEESETKVSNARLMTADLNIQINNLIGITGNLVFKIPSLRNDQNQPYLLNLPVEVGNRQFTRNLAGWHLVMSLDEQKIDYNYTLITDDTEPEFVHLTSEDSVQIIIELTNITFNEVTGIVEQQTVEDSGQVELNSRSKVLEAVISQGNLYLQIDNRIGGEADVNLVIDQLYNPDNLPLQRTLHIVPGINQTVISLADHQIRLPLEEQYLTYKTTTVTTPGLVDTYHLRDSILVDIQLSELTFSNITGEIHQDAIVKEDTIPLDNETKVESAYFGSGYLELTITNYVGTIADVHFTVDEIKKNGQSLNQVISLTASTEPQTTIFNLEGYSIELPLDDQVINYSSRIVLDSTQIMSLSLEDSIIIEVNLDDLSFQSVTGLISPVEVEIDTIEQEIDALPEEMENVEFDEINMYIDFNTNIGVPVFLDLDITSINKDGVAVTSSVSNWNITDSNLVIIPDATALINNKPERIIASGKARVGSTEIPGTVSIDQYVSGKLYLEAPLAFYFTPDSRVEIEHSEMEPIPEEFEVGKIFSRIDNQFEFGTLVNVLIARDTLEFEAGEGHKPDTLMTLRIPAETTFLDSVVLDTHKVNLMKDTVYVKPLVQVLGKDDNTPSRFLTTDSLKILLYGKFRIYADPNKYISDEEEGGVE